MGNNFATKQCQGIKNTKFLSNDKYGTFLWAWRLEKIHFRVVFYSSKSAVVTVFSLPAVIASQTPKPTCDLWPQNAQNRLLISAFVGQFIRTKEFLSPSSTSGASLPHHLFLCLIAVCVKSPPASPQQLSPNLKQSIKFSCASILRSHPTSIPSLALSLHPNLRLNSAFSELCVILPATLHPSAPLMLHLNTDVF